MARKSRRNKGVRITVTGVKEIDRALDGLGDKLRKKVLNKLLRSAAKPINKQAKALAPVGETGMLKKHIKTRKKKGAKRGDFALEVRTGTREEMGIPKDAPAYYPAVQEYGSEKKNIPAKRYMRTAYETKQGEARKIMRDGVADEVKKVKAKAAKK